MSQRRPRTSGRKDPVRLRGHVIPNSHLDREWTLEYQQTRRLTVEFLDRLLDILDSIPAYTFLLDSQTVPLEDYLEIRPENEGRIRAAVQAGRLSIGPWYTAPDPHTILGESLIRNLLTGDRRARRFGRPMKVGYTPFGFGQISQLPQIYAGFGIDTALFYRTISEHDAPDAEFLWKGADGTVALASRFGTKPRYNFFMDVWRPVAYGRHAEKRIHDWRDGGLPFKRVTPDREWDHYFILRPEKQFRLDHLEPAFRKLLEVERRHFTTPVIPLMQGMDTTMPDPMEAEIVEQLQQYLQPGEEVFFSTLEAYIDDLQAHLDRKKLRTLSGEMRRPGPPSPYVTTLENVASSRPRQKVAHARAELRLQRLAEPFASLAWTLDAAPYPKSYLDHAWRYLLLAHPHDTVAGTGVDKLETDTLYRLDQTRAISDVVFDDALAALQLRIDNSAVKEDEIVLTVFNPSPRPRTEVLDVFLDISLDLNMPDFEIVDWKGKEADFTFVYRKPGEKTVRDNTDLTNALVCWTCKVQLHAEAVPPMGYRTYIVRRSEAVGRMDRIAASPHRMENEFLRVDVLPDGTLTLTEKEAGRSWSGLHALTDQGESGQGWESRPAAMDEVISSRGAAVEIALVENTGLSATIRVRYVLEVPSGLEHNDTHHYTKRAESRERVTVESFFTLRKGARRLDIRTEIDNPARNHKLRAGFPTGLSGAKTSSAETPFDVVERAIDRGPGHPYSQAANPSYPMLRFVDVSDGKAGLAVMAEGVHEYEVTDDASRTIGLTLLRAYEVTLCTVTYRWERRPDQGLSQVPGPLTLRYSVFPHEGNWEKGGVPREVEDFALPLQAVQTSRGNGDAPREAALLELKPASLVLSALKRAEDSHTIVARVFNPGSRTVQASLVFPRALRSARLVDFNEEPVKGNKRKDSLTRSGKTVRFPIGPRKVLTIECELK